jgi:membrane protease YdiL (CAAX protease family)
VTSFGGGGGVGAIREPSRAAQAPPWIDAGVDRARLATALGVTLAISRLPEIVARDGLHLDVAWMPWAILGLTVGFWLASRFVEPLRPLERFLAVMILVNGFVAGLPVVLESPVWHALVPPSTTEMTELLATRLLYAFLGAVALGWAITLGASRDEAYVRVGDLDAQTRTQRKDGTYVRWGRFGPIAIVFLMLLMAWFGFPMLPDSIDLATAAPAIAIGALAALLNAWWEETAFRAAPLSMLQRAVGPGAAVLILALWFGIGHFYGGVPSGPMGLVATGAVAVLLGRAMIETHGLVWPVALHFAIDLVIFTFIAIASVG